MKADARRPKVGIFTTKYGKRVVKTSNTNASAVDALSGILVGRLPDDYTARALREERLARYTPVH